MRSIEVGYGHSNLLRRSKRRCYREASVAEGWTRCPLQHIPLDPNQEWGAFSLADCLVCGEQYVRSRAEASGLLPGSGSGGGFGPEAIRPSACSRMSARGLKGPAGAWNSGAAARRGIRATAARR